VSTTPLDIERRFSYHPPTTEARRAAHQIVRTGCWDLADTLAARLPDGREKALALTKVEEAMFWANAAIARQAPDPV